MEYVTNSSRNVQDREANVIQAERMFYFVISTLKGQPLQTTEVHRKEKKEMKNRVVTKKDGKNHGEDKNVVR